MTPILEKISRPAGKTKGRFVIFGLPRSGSTYLMTLLNSHRDVYCSGELYNPYAVIDVNDRDDSHETVIGRDEKPVEFLHGFFADAAEKPVSQVGFKFMLGHNIKVLKALADDPDIALIFVWRENRLAQAASLLKALKSRNWAQIKPDRRVGQKINATPRQISHRWHEAATIDFLFDHWFETLPHRKITLEYRELFQPEFETRICDFLGLAPDPKMKSRLVKQNPNSIRDRFVEPRHINYFFRTIGFGRWLDDEL